MIADESDNESVTSDEWARCEDIESEHSSDSEWSHKKERGKRKTDEAEITVEEKVGRFSKNGGGVEGGAEGVVPASEQRAFYALVGLTDNRKCFKREPLNITTCSGQVYDIGGSKDDEDEEDDGVEEEEEEDEEEEDKEEDEGDVAVQVDAFPTAEMAAEYAQKRQIADARDIMLSTLKAKAELKSTPKLSRIASIVQGMQTLPCPPKPKPMSAVSTLTPPTMPGLTEIIRKPMRPVTPTMPGGLTEIIRKPMRPVTPMMPAPGHLAETVPEPPALTPEQVMEVCAAATARWTAGNTEPSKATVAELKPQKKTRWGPRHAHLQPTSVLVELRNDKLDQDRYKKALAKLEEEQAMQRRLLFQQMMRVSE